MIPSTANLIQTLGRTGNSGLDNVRLNGSSPSLSGRSMQGGTPGRQPRRRGRSMSPEPARYFSAVSQTTTRSPSTNLPAGTRSPGQAQTIEDLLIKLITNTIKPQSWAEVGGSGTIDYFPLGMALVINQTPDVQEQVQELLDALRRLQDLEVSVEVRMISLEETFFERIGINFNIQIDPKVPRAFQSQIVTQQFQTLNQVNTPQANSVVFGLTPAGTPTSDLNIPISSSSFAQAIPPFGGYPNIPGADGGLSMGLAFLSDIQVFMFMEAAQGDRRTNVMQAPKLTLFNGQTATILVQDFQYFATNVQVVQANGQVMFVPQNQPIPIGVNLTVQAVISADRRFVRLNLAPTMNAVASATVPLFPVTTFITPVFEGGAQGQPIPFTQFLQQPTFTQVQIQTTVSVPDGGTVLLGGLKLLNEGRNEFGPPVLEQDPVPQPSVQERRLRPGHEQPADHGDAARHHQRRGRRTPDRRSQRWPGRHRPGRVLTGCGVRTRRSGVTLTAASLFFNPPQAHGRRHGGILLPTGCRPRACEVSPMLIAVTGATGFLGRYLVRRLASAGHRLRCWYRPSSDRSGLTISPTRSNGFRANWAIRRPPTSLTRHGCRGSCRPFLGRRRCPAPRRSRRTASFSGKQPDGLAAAFPGGPHRRCRPVRLHRNLCRP